MLWRFACFRVFAVLVYATGSLAVSPPANSASRCADPLIHRPLLTTRELIAEFAHENLDDADTVSALKVRLVRGYQNLEKGLTPTAEQVANLAHALSIAPHLSPAEKERLWTAIERGGRLSVEDLKVLEKTLIYRIQQHDLMDHALNRYPTDFRDEMDFVRIEIKERTATGLVLSKLGYAADGTHPSFYELARNLRKIWEKKGTPPSERIEISVPSIVYHHGQRRVEFLAVDEDEVPLNENFQLAAAGGMNSRQFAKAMAQLKFPVAGTHDIGGHLVSLVLHDDYRREMIEAFRFHSSNGPNMFRSRWLYFFFEELSLPDPAMKETLRKTLSFAHQDGVPTKFADVQRHFEQMSNDAVFAHAEKLSAAYEKFFKHYGGAFANVPERAKYLTTYQYASTVLRESLLQTPLDLQTGPPMPWGSYIYLGRYLQMALRLRGKENSLEAAKLFGANHEDRNLDPASLRRVVRDLLSRMEFGLWEGLRFRPETLIKTIMHGTPQDARPFLQYLEVLCSPNSNFYRALQDVSR